MSVIPICQDLPDELYLLYTLHLPSDIDPIFLRDQPFLCETLTECDLHVTFFLCLEDGTPAARLQARTRSAIEHALERFAEAIEEPCVLQEEYLLKDIPSLRNQELLSKYSNQMEVIDLVRPYPKELAIQRAEYAAILAERAAAASQNMEPPLKRQRPSSPSAPSPRRSASKQKPKSSGEQYIYQFLLPDDSHCRNVLFGEKSSRLSEMSDQAGLSHPAYVSQGGHLRLIGSKNSIRSMLDAYNVVVELYTARDPSLDFRHDLDAGRLRLVEIHGSASNRITRDVALANEAVAQLARKGSHRSERKWLTARYKLVYLTVVWDVSKPCLRVKGSEDALDAAIPNVKALSKRLHAEIGVPEPSDGNTAGPRKIVISKIVPHSARKPTTKTEKAHVPSAQNAAEPSTETATYYALYLPDDRYYDFLYANDERLSKSLEKIPGVRHIEPRPAYRTATRTLDTTLIIRANRHSTRTVISDFNDACKKHFSNHPEIFFNERWLKDDNRPLPSEKSSASHSGERGASSPQTSYPATLGAGIEHNNCASVEPTFGPDDATYYVLRLPDDRYCTLLESQDARVIKQLQQIPGIASLSLRWSRQPFAFVTAQCSGLKIRATPRSTHALITKLDEICKGQFEDHTQLFFNRRMLKPAFTFDRSQSNKPTVQQTDAIDLTTYAATEDDTVMSEVASTKASAVMPRASPSEPDVTSKSQPPTGPRKHQSRPYESRPYDFGNDPTYYILSFPTARYYDFLVLNGSRLLKELERIQDVRCLETRYSTARSFDQSSRAQLRIRATANSTAAVIRRLNEACIKIVPDHQELCYSEHLLQPADLIREAAAARKAITSNLIPVVHDRWSVAAQHSPSPSQFFTASQIDRETAETKSPSLQSDAATDGVDVDMGQERAKYACSDRLEEDVDQFASRRRSPFLSTTLSQPQDCSATASKSESSPSEDQLNLEQYVLEVDMKEEDTAGNGLALPASACNSEALENSTKEEPARIAKPEAVQNPVPRETERAQQSDRSKEASVPTSTMESLFTAAKALTTSFDTPLSTKASSPAPTLSIEASATIPTETNNAVIDSEEADSLFSAESQADVIDLTASPDPLDASSGRSPMEEIVSLNSSAFIKGDSRNSTDTLHDLSKKEKYIRCTLEIPHGSRPKLVGKHYVQCRDIEIKTGVHLSLHPDRQNHFITLTASNHETIKDALVMILDVLCPCYPHWALPTELEDTYQLKRPTLNEERVVILQQPRLFIMKLSEFDLAQMSRCGCAFALDRFANKITLRGTKSAIARGLQEVQHHFERLWSNFHLPSTVLDEYFPNGLSCSSQWPNLYLSSIFIPEPAIDRMKAEQAALLIGTRCRTAWGPNEFCISGEYTQIRTILQQVEELLKEFDAKICSTDDFDISEEFCLQSDLLETDYYRPDKTRCSFQLPSLGRRLIFGVSGSNRDHIQRRTAATVKLDSGQKLVVEGEPEKVKAALAHVTSILKSEWTNWCLPLRVSRQLHLKTAAPTINGTTPDDAAKRIWYVHFRAAQRHDSSFEASMIPLPTNEQAVLIGFKGSAKEDICRSSGATIQVEVDFCSVSGRWLAIHRALHYISFLLKAKFPDFDYSDALKMEFDLYSGSGLLSSRSEIEEKERKRRRSVSPRRRSRSPDRRRNERRERSPRRSDRRERSPERRRR